MLLEQKAYAEGAVALCLYCAKLVDGGDDPESRSLLALLTPVAKTWPSEFGLAANDGAIQVHGGYGYTRDYDVEQLYRDNRLNAIHEGTTGIQALDLLGRKILRDKGHGLAIAGARIGVACDRGAGSAECAGYATALREAWAGVLQTVRALEAAPGTSAFDNATPFLRAFGHVVVAWLWLEQALVAEAHRGSPYHDGKLRACRFFFECELPRAAQWLALVSSGSDVWAGADPATF